ncbi:gfo/Idh/MocA family oxidoreductase [Marinomonas hwangdonensis]|uniref:Gfo/Idh/MocA family oxidoreductase n=1 Tax=Marinomonas hwangdonensis TaxID=1053647 RepID=A0A3M8Q0V1_9GAMM|nr:Gfo/Idh/MocA family oxidoreductase [Marinomonas hwangdonensis]RNF48794.1 gfo/Idh/MocA family oxidoreductase [Marinomonas hwangdonensis]
MLNIGLIGYGYWGPNVARNLHVNSKICLKWICDNKYERIEKAKSTYIAQTNYTQDHHMLMNDPELDAVAIAVETSAHYYLVKQALLAGKHVYVEKPFTSTVKEAEELHDLATKLNLKIHVDHIMVHHPVIKKIADLVNSGELGDILYIDAMRMNLGQIKKDVSAMWDLAVHDLAIIDFLTGGKEPYFLSALGEKYYNPKESLCFLTMRYPGFISHIQSSWISPLKERKLIVAGTRKMLVFDDIKPSEKLVVYDKGVNIIAGDSVEYEDYAVKIREGDILVPFIKMSDALFNSIDHFRECIEKNTQSITGTDQAIRIQKILERADQGMNQ